MYFEALLFVVDMHHIIPYNHAFHIYYFNPTTTALWGYYLHFSDLTLRGKMTLHRSQNDKEGL